MEKYIDTVVAFKFNGKVHYALVYGVNKDKKLLCYRVVSKTKESNKYIPIQKLDGSAAMLQVQYGCKFIMPDGCSIKPVLRCHPQVIKKALTMYNQLPSVDSLINKKKQVEEQIRKLPPKERRSLLNEYNKLAQIINERSTSFLQETAKSKDKDKYSNYRMVPDKKGIRRVCAGGKVSPK